MASRPAIRPGPRRRDVAGRPQPAGERTAPVPGGRVLRQFQADAFQPPAVRELACVNPRNEKRVRELIDLAVARGQLVRIAENLWLHQRRWEELVDKVTAALRERGQLTVAEIRTLLGSSRKYVVPIAEYLDSAGITRRVGDQRVLGPKAPV